MDLRTRLDMFLNELMSALNDDYDDAEDLFWNTEYSVDKETYDLKLNTYLSGYMYGLCAGLEFNDRELFLKTCRNAASKLMLALVTAKGAINGNDHP